LNEELLSSSVLLAQLDGVFRSGGMLPASGEFLVTPEDISDLRQLTQVCDWTQWRAAEKCLLNPVFERLRLLFWEQTPIFNWTALYELKTVRKIDSYRRTTINWSAILH
jgi:hypothetical protein